MEDQGLAETNSHSTANISKKEEELVLKERLTALAEMARRISHDLNNSLQPILLSGGMLLELKLDDPADRENFRTYADYIIASAQEASDLLKRLVRFYRADTQDAPSAINLKEVALAAIELTKPLWNSATRGGKISISADLGDDWVVFGRRAEVQEVLVNLITNAVEAIAKDGQISVAAQLDGKFVVITVRDTGAGMSDDVQRRCFEPMFTTKKSVGAGLGLSIAYGIVTRQGGDIRVESAPGQGTAVIIRWPRPEEKKTGSAQAR